MKNKKYQCKYIVLLQGHNHIPVNNNIVAPVYCQKPKDFSLLFSANILNLFKDDL